MNSPLKNILVHAYEVIAWAFLVALFLGLVLLPLETVAYAMEFLSTFLSLFM